MYQNLIIHLKCTQLLFVTHTPTELEKRKKENIRGECFKEITLDIEKDHRGGLGRAGGGNPFCVVTGRIGRGHLCEDLRSKQRKQQGPVRNRQETGVGGGLWWGRVFPDEAEEGDKS